MPLPPCSSPLTPGSHVILTVEKPVAGGRMLARHQGQVVFVAGAIPGERVRTRVERVARHLAFASTVEVIEPSSDRRSAPIDWACGGSLYAHVEYPRQLSLKSELVADAFARIGKMPLATVVPVLGSEEQGYRMRARLHAKDGTFGFFREGTHELCDAAPTRQLLPSTLDALQRLQEALKAAGATGVMSCEVSENIPATQRAVLIELEPTQAPALAVEPVAGITGVFFVDPQNARPTIAYGSPYVTDRLEVAGATVELTRHVQSFFQGNRHLCAELAARVLAWVPDGVVIDLYAGVGLFALSLAARGGRQIVAVEGDRSSARDLDSNASAYRAAVHVEHASVEEYLARRRTERPDTLLLDPPRTGVSPEAMSGVLGLAAARIVYVSCDPATAARDAKRLVEGGYSLEHVESFDLFPNTAHVETLMVLAARS